MIGGILINLHANLLSEDISKTLIDKGLFEHSHD